MNKPSTVIRIPESALHELDAVERMDWSSGLSLEELLSWVNEVASRFRPDEIGDDSRSSGEFTARTFRHYQTLGCIDAPERTGRRVVYRFRQYVQALLLRKLLWERLPSDKIAALMKGRSTAETKNLLLQGIEVVAANAPPSADTPPRCAEETWRRMAIAPGIELHLRGDLPKPKTSELSEILARIETTLRKSIEP